MELAKADTATIPMANAQSLTNNPVVRQLGVMIGIAASVALGVSVVLWSQTPSYSMLYGNLTQKDASEVVTALQQAGIKYEIDEKTGAVLVPSADLQEARMKLAGSGLPRGDGLGFEMLQQETGFGTSRAMEAARFQKALEGELARTIATLANVESARVHIANPKQSVFARKRKEPSASVALRLYSGRTLEKGQVDSIVHLVASSVPELNASNVTVVDQKGRLLSSSSDGGEMAMTSSQFEYTRDLENLYKQRIEDLLIPVLGEANVRAQVTADVDFTVTEQTQESYNPDMPALRSEQINEQSSRSGSVQGVPGALSNQPPAAGNAPEVAGQVGEGEGGAAAPASSSKGATRNYELDRTLSHTRLSTGNLRRLSVAVVVDDHVSVNEEGVMTRAPRTEEEVARITTLVREAIGFDASRGDSIQVINSAFEPVEVSEPLPEQPIWEQAWVWDIARQVGGVLLVLVLIFGVLKPTLKRLTAPPVIVKSEKEDGDDEEGGAESRAGVAALAGGAGLQLPGPQSYEQTLDAARQMISNDPKRVAQVVKKWVGQDGGK